MQRLLAAEEAQQVEQHLATCAVCQKVLAAMLADTSPSGPGAPAEDLSTPMVAGSLVGTWVLLAEVDHPLIGKAWLAGDAAHARRAVLELVRTPSGHDRTADESGLRLLTAAKAGLRLRHRCFVPILEVGTASEDRAFVAYEASPTASLATWREQRRPTTHEILELYTQIGGALLEAHGQGLGLDFSAERVGVDSDGRPRLAAFPRPDATAERDSRAFASALSRELSTGAPARVRRALEASRLPRAVDLPRLISAMEKSLKLPAWALGLLVAVLAAGVAAVALWR